MVTMLQITTSGVQALGDPLTAFVLKREVERVFVQLNGVLEGGGQPP